ncbi:hypothetical protein AAFF_G00282190 [Aldrovandia affinis]|uniref:Uncharacterized protein n=1 Tax=Aldrovandia affinis TaxID=143900 RepID=A0AAD7TAH2_9TELE|nr:hypothetical protein AAFF_G00282190 [Aldrovandia affinis]
MSERVDSRRPRLLVGTRRARRAKTGAVWQASRPPARQNDEPLSARHGTKMNRSLSFVAHHTGTATADATNQSPISLTFCSFYLRRHVHRKKKLCHRRAGGCTGGPVKARRGCGSQPARQMEPAERDGGTGAGEQTRR